LVFLLGVFLSISCSLTFFRVSSSSILKTCLGHLNLLFTDESS
jgi:hypothetical protein